MCYWVKVVVYGNKCKCQGYHNRKYFSEFFESFGVLIVRTHGLERGGKAVPQVQAQQHKRNHVKDGSPNRFEFLDRFMVVTCGVLRIGLNIFVGHFVYPEIVEVQCQESKDHKTGINHVPRDPRCICASLVLNIAYIPCFFVLDFQNKAHYKVNDYTCNQNRLHQELDYWVVAHKMGCVIKKISEKIPRPN